MGRQRLITLSSPEETLAFGKKVGSQLPKNSILALSGNLGAGKTTFVQGIALGLGIQESVASPTFVYLQVYEGMMPLFHFDLYRMQGNDDFLGMGFEEYFEKEGICAIEWPERIASLLPQRAVILNFSHTNHHRTVSIDGVVQWD
jgi:tRNA threonylcarbamoyladenosine biosynthesis protein TsaE